MALSVVEAAAAPAETLPTALLRPRLADALREDRGWLIAAVAALLALTSTPYLVAALAGPRDLVRVGTFWFFRDFTQYLAAMHDAAAGAWLLQNRFSAEPHRAILMYVPYVALGKLAALLGVDALAAYYPVEFASRFVLALALWLFAATFLDSARLRRLAYLLTAFTLGLAAWVLPARGIFSLLGRPDLVAYLPDGVNVFLEMNSFGVFLSAPHLMLGLALTLALPAAYLAAARGERPWLPTLLALLLVLIHPFNLPVVLSVLGLDALWRRRRDHDARGLLAILAAGVVAAPFTLYNAALFALDPFWSGTYGAQNVMPSPSPLSVWVDFGLVAIAAPFGLYMLRPFRRPEQRLLLIWIVATFAWLYVPVLFQRRLGFGLQPALAVAAAIAIVAWQDRARRGRLGTRPLNYPLTLLALCTSVLVFISLVASAAGNKPTQVYLWTRNEQAAADWLAAHSGPDAVVLSSIESGNALVGTIPGRVVVGHIVATLHDKQKEELARQFFATDTPPDQREQLLRQSGATYVFAGWQERKVTPLDLDTLPSLERVYEAGGVTIYHVRGATA